MGDNNSYRLFQEKKMEVLRRHLSMPAVVAEQIQSPENIGSILRLAANIGAVQVLFLYDTPPHYKQYKINKHASGAAEKVGWQFVSYSDLSALLPENYQWVAIETTGDAENIYTGHLPEKTVFFVGNERYGLSERVLSMISKRYYIPVPGVISSFNVSHALAIALFEWLRQQQYLNR